WGLNGLDKPDPIFIPHAQQGLLIAIELKVRKHNPTQAKFNVLCRLSNFSLDLIAPASFIVLHFDKIEFLAGTSTKPDVNCVLKGLEFVGVLSFVETLRHLTPLDGFGDPPALAVTAKGIDASYSVGLPNIGIGVLSLQNLSLGAGFTIPFIGEPLSVR